jgi:hypothetical protein
MMTDTTSADFLLQISEKFHRAADPVKFGVTLKMDKDISLLVIEYQLKCEAEANGLGAHEHTRKAEISHRYFKMLKLAGAYAYIDNSPKITEDHVYNAIKLVEDSGEAFKKLLKRDRNFVKLAKYIAEADKEITHVELVEDLPYYKGSGLQKKELMELAIAWGYQNNIIIKKTYQSNIEFLRGESLQETSLNEINISFSNHMAFRYQNIQVPFDRLHELTQEPGLHWVAHQLIGGDTIDDQGAYEGHRSEENAIQGFNLIVLDIDKDISIETAKLLMKDYKFLIYTTKRHTNAENRFRMILPMSHTLKMDKPDYRAFMENIFEWLPFNVDDQTIDRCRKWETFPGTHEYNDGELVNSLLFIPKTTKNDERKKFVADHQSMSNMERWFVSKSGVGNRSNNLIKYALMLVDAGLDFLSIDSKVRELNDKFKDKMSDTEIGATIMVSANNAIKKRDS